MPTYIRVKDLPNEATAQAADDFIMFSGATSGSRKISRANFLSSVADFYKNNTLTYQIATLDSTGKVNANQLPASAFNYQGLWNADTNSPSLANGTGSAGSVYYVSTAGSTNFGAGAISFIVGDGVIYDGDTWTKIPAVSILKAPELEITSATGTASTLALTVKDSDSTNFYVKEDGTVKSGVHFLAETLSNNTQYASNYIRATGGAFYIDNYTTGGDTIFRASVASAIDTQAMLIDGATGFVGIGGSPTYELDVKAANARIAATSTSGCVNHLQADNTGAYVGPLSNHSLFLKTNNTTRATIDSSGNVGIGADPGSTKLRVSGGSGQLFKVDDGTNALVTVDATGDVKAGAGTFPVAALAGIQIANGASSYSYFSATDDTKQFAAGIDHTLSEGVVGMISNHGLRVVTNNTERLRVDASGRLLVGVTTSTAKLHVAGDVKISGETHPTLDLIPATNSGDSIIRFRNTADDGTVAMVKAMQTGGTVDRLALGCGGSEHLVISAAGNVGVGAEPGSTVMRVSGGSGQLFKVDDGANALLTVDATGDVTITGDTSDAYTAGTLKLTAGNLGTNSIQLGDVSDADIGMIQYANSDNSMRVTTNGSERLRVDQSGNTGFGQSSPSTKVDVNGVLTIDTDYAPSSAVGGLALGDYQGGGYKWVQSMNSQPLVLNPLGNNVGIGTASPSAGLHLERASTDNVLAIVGQDGYNGTLFLSAEGSGKDAYLTVGGDRNLQIDFATSSTPASTGTNKFTFSKLGRLGIGTSSPQSSLHVNSSTADNLRLERDATNDWRIQLTSGALAFRDATADAERCRIDSSGNLTVSGGRLEVQTTGGDAIFSLNRTDAKQYNIYVDSASDLNVRDQSAGSTRFKITGSGDVNVGAGNLVIGTSGKGIDFSATGDGSGTISSEVLDDYEEGTWTPVFAPSGGSFASLTMNVVAARYCKVGHQVSVNCYCQTTGLDTSGASGQVMVTGLPYANAGSNNFVATHIGYAIDWTEAPSGGYINQSSTQIVLNKRYTGITGSLSPMDVNGLNTASGSKNTIMLTATYNSF